VTAIQLTSPEQDPLQAARQSGAVFVNPRWDSMAGASQSLAPEWIQRVHDAGLGIISWPVDNPAEIDSLQRLGLDVIWLNRITNNG
jgi:glycerophosphoryl diester phosphodiesterase